MTYSYSNRVGSVKLLGLARLLGIWRASVYKLVFRELLLFCIIYLSASCVYRFGLRKEEHKKVFEKIVVYCGTFESILPVTFVLGFYVSIIVQRWWAQFNNIPWPDRIMSYIAVLIPGKDEQSLMLRRTLVRYLILAEVLLLMAVSAPVKKRFPTTESLVDQGLMTKSELDLYDDEQVPHISSKYWLPTHWFAMLLNRARREKKITDNYSLCVLLDELSSYKSGLGTVFSYDWISLPLVYTQVATVAVYVFYFNTIFSRQYINYANVRKEFGPEISAKYSIDLYFPVDTLLQLFFYLGWLKVAEQMINPFGEDDDDFECNWIIDRNLKVGLYAVSTMEHPLLEKDAWWDKEDPQMWYTEASEKFAMAEGWFGSTANLDLNQQAWHNTPVYMPNIAEDGDAEETEADAESGSNFTSTHTVNAGVTPSSRRGSHLRRLPPLLVPADTLRAAKEALIGKSRRRRTRTTVIHSRTQSPDLSRSLPAGQFLFDNISDSHSRGVAAEAAGDGAAAANQPADDCARDFGHHLADIDELTVPAGSVSGDNGFPSTGSFGTSSAEAVATDTAGDDGIEEIRQFDRVGDNADSDAVPLLSEYEDDAAEVKDAQQQQRQRSASQGSDNQSAMLTMENGSGQGEGEEKDQADSQEKHVAFNPQIERLEYDATHPLLQAQEEQPPMQQQPEKQQLLGNSDDVINVGQEGGKCAEEQSGVD